MKDFTDLQEFADNMAIIEKDGMAHTYRDVLNDAVQFSLGLDSLRKTLIFIHASNHYAAFIGYLGSMLSNCACMLLNPDMHPDLLQRLQQIYMPDYIWKSKTPKSDGYVLETIPVNRPYRIHPDVKLLIPTSGSTGSPKIVKLSMKNLDENAKSIMAYLELTATERPILSLPMYYVYGLSIVNSHLRSGAAILLTDDDILSKSFWAFFDQQHATSLAGVPYSYDVFRKLGIEHRDMPFLRSMTQAGGKLSKDQVSWFGEKMISRGVRFYVMYGQTEAAPRMSWLPWQDCLRKPDSIGIPIPGGRIEIHDVNDENITSPHVQGELIYHGKNVMLGYAYEGTDLEKGDEMGGVLHTGDMGHFDDDGYFYITGRKSRFIKISGNRFGLDEIEQYLRSLQLECAVGGRDDKLEAIITDPARVAEAKTLIGDTFHLHHSLIDVRYMEAIPRNATGKPLYGEIFK